jgi:hypothetical protein
LISVKSQGFIPTFIDICGYEEVLEKLIGSLTFPDETESGVNFFYLCLAVN